MKKQISTFEYNVLTDKNIDKDFRELIAQSLGVEIPEEKPIYCPKCLEKDGLHVQLKDLLCPQCRTQYDINDDKLFIK